MRDQLLLRCGRRVGLGSVAGGLQVPGPGVMQLMFMQPCSNCQPACCRASRCSGTQPHTSAKPPHDASIRIHPLAATLTAINGQAAPCAPDCKLTTSTLPLTTLSLAPRLIPAISPPTTFHATCKFLCRASPLLLCPRLSGRLRPPHTQWPAPPGSSAPTGCGTVAVQRCRVCVHTMGGVRLTRRVPKTARRGLQADDARKAVQYSFCVLQPLACVQTCLYFPFVPFLPTFTVNCPVESPSQPTAMPISLKPTARRSPHLAPQVPHLDGHRPLCHFPHVEPNLHSATCTIVRQGAIRVYVSVAMPQQKLHNTNTVMLIQALMQCLMCQGTSHS